MEGNGEEDEVSVLDMGKTRHACTGGLDEATGQAKV